MEKILEVKNLDKYYGKFQAVKNVSFNIDENEIFALVGPNGAGKSTILKTIATVLSLEHGDIFVAGENLKKQAKKIRKIMSYLPEEAGAYKNLTGNEYLNFMAGLYADNKQEQRAIFEFGQDLSGLKNKLKNKAKTYSKGMTRKLLLARTIMTKPRLAILDEPTSGLDVINSLEIRKVIKNLAAQGMAVLLSSHNMLEIEFLSEKLSIIDQGEIKITGSPQELKNKYNSNNLEEVFINVSGK
ncbi:MAG: ATP-binding cassette domain-containing protein [Candidatus Buchananbacteria bacterium]|nr:ATP-binding cassette domain-containing protein [Candidatus Buchananbacteria bacterium]